MHRGVTKDFGLDATMPHLEFALGVCASKIVQRNLDTSLAGAPSFPCASWRQIVNGSINPDVAYDVGVFM